MTYVELLAIFNTSFRACVSYTGKLKDTRYNTHFLTLSIYRERRIHVYKIYVLFSFAALLFVQLNFTAMKRNMVKFILRHLVTNFQPMAANCCGSTLRMKWYLKTTRAGFLLARGPYAGSRDGR